MRPVLPEERLSFPTPLGDCEVHWTGDRLTGFRLPETPPAAANVAGAPPAMPDWIQQLVVRVQAHLRGELQEFAGLPYAFDEVSTFQRSVYEAALQVSAGTTRTYGWIARRIAASASSNRSRN